MEVGRWNLVEGDGGGEGTYCSSCDSSCCSSCSGTDWAQLPSCSVVVGFVVAFVDAVVGVVVVVVVAEVVVSRKRPWRGQWHNKFVCHIQVVVVLVVVVVDVLSLF